MAEHERAVRAFFALPVPHAARRELLGAQQRMKGVDARQLRLRWARDEQLHLTLKFLGNVAADRIAELSAIGARRAREHAPIEVRATGVIAFGGASRARALVAEITSCSALMELQRALEQDAEALGIAREQRAFRPHVTLARLARPGSARALLEAAALAELPIAFEELRLYRSQLTSDGGRYTVLQSSPLGG